MNINKTHYIYIYCNNTLWSSSWSLSYMTSSSSSFVFFILSIIIFIIIIIVIIILARGKKMNVVQELKMVNLKVSTHCYLSYLFIHIHHIYSFISINHIYSSYLSIYHSYTAKNEIVLRALTEFSDLDALRKEKRGDYIGAVRSRRGI